MKKITKALSLVMIMTLCIFTLTACGGSDDANAGADTEKEAMTTLVFGTSADYAPFEFMYPDENGDMVYGGIDVEVAQYIADYMGVKLQTENMSFNNLLTALNKGQFDIVLADIEATDERKEAADHKIAPSGSTAARYASSSAGSIFATRIFFSHMRFNPTQKIRIEPTSAM